MAEFNATAFSAVDSFFVIDTQGTTEDHAAVPPSKNSAFSSSKQRRLGVGAAAAKPSTKPELHTITSRLMKVGNNKRNRSDDNEEEDVPDDDDEEEEEPGRTGIVSETKTSHDQLESAPTTKKKKKKKSGKKERQKVKENEAQEMSEPPAVSQESPNSKTKDSSASTTTTANPEAQQPNRKRKRRKVRSRQKNIYKDNRAVDQKPDHLIPGGYEYKGRPITPQTQAKLAAKHGGEAVSSDFRSHWDANHQEDDSGVPVLSSEAKTVVAKKDGARSSAASLPPKKTVKSKKKKPKYKNIQ